MMYIVWPLVGASIGFTVASLMGLLEVIHHDDFAEANRMSVTGAIAGAIDSGLISLLRYKARR